MLSLGWLATNCTNLMPPSARIVCTVHNAQCARFTTHIVAHLTLTAVAAERVQWSKRSWSVVEVSTLCGRRRKKMYTRLCCESVPHTSSCTGWLRWVGVDSVLKLKFKCRQCVKAPLLVKDTLEVDNRCPSKHPRIGILLYLYFHLYPIQISAGLTERLFI